MDLDEFMQLGVAFRLKGFCLESLHAGLSFKVVVDI